MKDEIKEYVTPTLEYLRECVEDDIIFETSNYKALLDYITNLQAIEQQYSTILSENAELENKITNLQQENVSLKEDNKKKTSRCTERNHQIRCRDRKLERRNKKISKLEDYKSRCEKAIPMLKELNIKLKDILKIGIDIKEISDIENILNGGDE